MMMFRIILFVLFLFVSGCFYQKKVEKFFNCHNLNKSYEINVSSIGLYPDIKKNQYISQDIYYISFYIKDNQIKPTYYIVYAGSQKYVGRNFIHSSYSKYDDYEAYLLSNIENQFLEIDLSNNVKIGDEIKIKISMNNNTDTESICKMNEKISYFSFPVA